MKLFSLSHEQDYGHDFYVIIGRMKSRSLMQFAFGSGIYGFSTRLRASIDECTPFNIFVSFWKVYFTIEIFSYNWRG